MTILVQFFFHLDFALGPNKISSKIFRFNVFEPIWVKWKQFNGFFACLQRNKVVFFLCKKVRAEDAKWSFFTADYLHRFRFRIFEK